MVYVRNINVENEDERMMGKNNAPCVKNGRRKNMFCKDTMKLNIED
jgi:hypothetical protein